MSVANKNRRRGKNCERALAKRVGGRRVGLMGKDDIEHPVWSFEAKSRVRFGPERWLEQAERNTPQGKTPAVIVHVHNKPYGKAMVIMRLEAFESHNGECRPWVFPPQDDP